MLVSQQDLGYFLDFYGRDGVYETEGLEGVTLPQLEAACQKIQARRKYDGFEFDSFVREEARDELLAAFGMEPIGYIYSPTDRWLGMEHLQVPTDPVQPASGPQ